MGAGGLIGTKVVQLLKADGHEVVPASRSSGVDVVTGAGIVEALEGADVLVDVTNSPSFEADAVMEFFTAGARNLVRAAAAARVRHYVVLSIVGVDGLPGSPYMRAKVAQERIITESGLRYTVLRATQFSEFTADIVDSLTVGHEVRVPDALIQPVPADEVAAAIARTAVAEPVNGILNMGGPRSVTFAEMAREVVGRRDDNASSVVVDPDARYFGAALATHSLVPADAADREES